MLKPLRPFFRFSSHWAPMFFRKGSLGQPLRGDHERPLLDIDETGFDEPVLELVPDKQLSAVRRHGRIRFVGPTPECIVGGHGAVIAERRDENLLAFQITTRLQMVKACCMMLVRMDFHYRVWVSNWIQVPEGKDA